VAEVVVVVQVAGGAAVEQMDIAVVGNVALAVGWGIFEGNILV
jgi:hypothetical protein